MMTQKIAFTLLRLAFVYVFYLVLLRLTGKRLIGMGKQSGSRQFQVGSPFDLVVALIISDLPDDMIFGSVPLAQGVVAVGTVFILHLVTSILSMRIPAFARLVEGEAIPLIHKGQVVTRNAVRERITDSELDMMLRDQGIDKRQEVEAAYLEPSGQLGIKRQEEFKLVEQRDLKVKRGVR